MNILLVNLTRFGDLLQSQAAISALACPLENISENITEDLSEHNLAEYQAEHEDLAEHNLAIVCLENFAFTSIFLRYVRQVFPLPRDGFLPGLASAPRLNCAPVAGSANWLSSLSDLWQWRENLWSKFKPDLVCNLTPTVPARLLSSYLADKAELSGFSMDEFGFGQEDAWAAFLRGASRSRFASPFNIIDLFRAVAGKSIGKAQDSSLKSRPEADVLAMRGQLLAELEKNSVKFTQKEFRGFVGFQLGASANQRRWPLEYFLQLGQELWQTLRLVPVLLGSKTETELAERFAELETFCPSPFPFVAMSGKTSPAELAGVLKNCLLLVSNDTGTLHLAAGLACPSLGIFLATAQPWDTGPGLVGSCALEPDLACHPCAFGSKCKHDFECRKTIKPELVFRLIESFFNSGSWPAVKDSARIWVTRRDKNNFFYLDSLSGHNQAPRTLWLMQQRLFLRQFIDRDPDADFVLEQNNGNLDGKFILPDAEREKLAADLTMLEAQFEFLTELGKILSLKPSTQMQTRFLATVQRISTLFENSAYFLALGFLWQTQVQEQGADLQKALRCIAQYRSLIIGLKQYFC